MDSAKPRSLRSRLLTGFAGLVALPVLYLASFGPFCYLFARADIQDERILSLYYPLRGLADRSPPPAAGSSAMPTGASPSASGTG